MDRFERQEKVRAARRRLRAQRMRAGALRSRIVVISLVTFVLLWGVVFAQMATGNDPVLGSGSSAQEARAAPETATNAIETTEPDEVEAELAEPEPVEPEAVELAPVTTSQS